MKGAEILQLHELLYSDLLLLSSISNDVSLSPPLKELERLEAIRTTVLETLGPRGPGLLSVIGVPNASLLRHKLLPLARKLALLNPEERKRILKEHNLGSDVPLKDPNRKVSSFAMKLPYPEASESMSNLIHDGLGVIDNSRENQVNDDDDNEFSNLGSSFKKLGSCMMELGLCVARVCDYVIGGKELEQSLLDSGTAKGRLIHYHSNLDTFNLKECDLKTRGSTLNVTDHNCDVQTNIWQNWHYDYGIFTVLTNPLFYLWGGDQERCSPSGDTCLQIFNPSKKSAHKVKASTDSLIIQVGESADILSKGKLRSSLHCVCRPSELKNTSRETFAVFLQPSWNKTLSIADYSMEHSRLSDLPCNKKDEDHGDTELSESEKEIYKMIPPLASRLKDGMTFAEFSRETTKQYYGGSGIQPNK